MWWYTYVIPCILGLVYSTITSGNKFYKLGPDDVELMCVDSNVSLRGLSDIECAILTSQGNSYNYAFTVHGDRCYVCRSTDSLGPRNQDELSLKGPHLIAGENILYPLIQVSFLSYAYFQNASLFVALYICKIHHKSANAYERFPWKDNNISLLLKKKWLPAFICDHLMHKSCIISEKMEALYFLIVCLTAMSARYFSPGDPFAKKDKFRLWHGFTTVVICEIQFLIHALISMTI